MDVIVAQGYNEAMGARELRRAVTRLVDDALSDAVLRGEVRRRRGQPTGWRGFGWGKSAEGAWEGPGRRDPQRGGASGLLAHADSPAFCSALLALSLTNPCLAQPPCLHPSHCCANRCVRVTPQCWTSAVTAPPWCSTGSTPTTSCLPTLCPSPTRAWRHDEGSGCLPLYPLGRCTRPAAEGVDGAPPTAPACLPGRAGRDVIN